MKNSAMKFQRLENDLSSNLKICEVYIDDFIVYSNSWNEHKKHIRALLERLTEAILTVNLVKSEIVQAHIKFLSHVVGQGEVKLIQAKVEGILGNCPAPTDKRQLMRFHSMSGDFYIFLRYSCTFNKIAKAK